MSIGLSVNGSLPMFSQRTIRYSAISQTYGSAGKESTCNARDLGSILGLERSPGEGKGYPPPYSGLENSMDCIVHGVTKSRAGLSDFHFLLLHMSTGSRTHGLQKLWLPGSRAQKLWHVGSEVVALRLQSTGSIVVAHGLSCSSACFVL